MDSIALRDPMRHAVSCEGVGTRRVPHNTYLRSTSVPHNAYLTTQNMHESHNERHPRLVRSGFFAL